MSPHVSPCLPRLVCAARGCTVSEALALPISPYISPHLPTSPHISPHHPTSPHISSYLPISPKAHALHGAELAALVHELIQVRVRGRGRVRVRVKVHELIQARLANRRRLAHPSALAWRTHPLGAPPLRRPPCGSHPHPRCTRDAPEMHPRCTRDAPGMHPRCASREQPVAPTAAAGVRAQPVEPAGAAALLPLLPTAVLGLDARRRPQQG